MQGNYLAELKQKIIDYAASIGIDKIGFAGPGPMFEHLPRLLRRQTAGYRFGLKEGDPEQRINPQAHLPTARSVVSAAVAYSRQELIPDGTFAKRGRISLISRGLDYHMVVGEKLNKLKDFMLAEVPEAQILAMVDKSPILEKALAVKAGLGWFGKNTLLMTPEFGSWVCLGELITDIPFQPDEMMSGDCGTCRRCIEACPTGALQEGEDLDLDKCLACVTLMKDLPEPAIREKMQDMLYGCDLCQLACPRSQPAEVPEHPEFYAEPDDAYPALSDILQLTNTGFKSRFGHTSGAWRGRTPMQRNAVIAVGNLGYHEAIPALTSILNSDPRPVMRGAAAWALGRIGGPEGRNVLEQSMKTEVHPEVGQEIRDSIDKSNR